MPIPTPETLEKITAAARMKVEGATWRVIATRLGYSSEDSAQSFLAGDYPELWKKAYEEARALYLNTIEERAVKTQVELSGVVKYVYDAEGKPKLDKETGKPMLIERDERIRQSAAHSLLFHTRQLRAQKISLTVDRPVTHIILDAAEVDNGKQNGEPH